MRIGVMLAAVAALAGCTAVEDAPTTTQVTGADDIEVGRYLVKVGGCNDCHTPGYIQSGGQTPEAQWLTGSSMGYHGPWGTTYPHNLRLTVANISEDDWVEMLSTRTASPPMPWPSVRALSDDNKRALYRYIKTLGPVGQAAPSALPPGVVPTTPYENLLPVIPGKAG